MPFTLAAPRSEVEPSRPHEFPRTSTTSTTNTNAVTGTITNTNHYPQRQRNSCSALGHMLRTNSMVRYGTLIFLIALISVLYFATTHQVLKPTGVGPTIIIDVFTYNQSKPPKSDEFLSAEGSSIQPYDTYESSTRGNVQQIVEGSLHNNTVTPLKGALYDRGDGCNPKTTPPFGDNFDYFKIGLISSDITNCQIKQKVENSLADKDLAIIFKLNNPDDVAGLNQDSYGITIFTIDKLIGDVLSEKMQSLSTQPTQTDSTSVLVATLSPYRQLIVSSWLFAMFAVGGILVASFFVSILIHMRLYRLRRNQQDEVRRQRAADEVLGMKKWTLEKEVIDTFPIIIYKNSMTTTEVSEAKPTSTSDDLGSTSEAVKDSAEQIENSEPTSTNQQLHRSTSTRSTRSIRSTRSTKSTRTLNAINNATNLYNSTTTPTSPTSPTTPITPIAPITSTTSAAVDGASTTDDNEVEACAICIEDFAEGDELRLLPCKHWYHVECIDPWLTTKSSSCPLCKTDCRPSQFDEIVIDSPVIRPPIRDNNIESERSNTNVVIRMGRAASKLFGGRRGTSVRPSNTQPPQNNNNDSTVVELEMENVNSSRTREE